MKIPDVNVLAYSVNVSSPQHEQAQSWLREALAGPSLAGFTWISLAGFLRLSTNPRVISAPLTPAKALSAIDDWLSAPAARQISPGSQHLSILGRLMIEHEITGGHITDARLAAIALEHDATLATFDADFHRFAELKLDYLGAR